MQETYYKNLRRNMEEMTGRLENKREQTKREITGGKDSLADTLPEDCLVG